MNEKNVEQGGKLWVRKEDALNIFQIGIRNLKKFTEEGFVRSVKFNDAQTARRVYYTEDLNNLLCAIAENRKPIKVVGR